MRGILRTTGSLWRLTAACSRGEARGQEGSHAVRKALTRRQVKSKNEDGIRSWFA